MPKLFFYKIACNLQKTLDYKVSCYSICNEYISETFPRTFSSLYLRFLKSGLFAFFWLVDKNFLVL